MRKLMHSTYLGDGVYAGFDGCDIWVYTDNGAGVNNQICLDGAVLRALVKYEQETFARIFREKKTCDVSGVEIDE